MQSSTRLAATGLATLLWLAAVAPAGAADPDLSSHPLLGEQAPAFSLATLDGGTLSLADLRGRFVVIHFGASW